MSRSAYCLRLIAEAVALAGFLTLVIIWSTPA